MKENYLINRKLSKTIFVALMLGLSVTGCLETMREIPITMTVSASALHFPFSGEKKKITIDSNTNVWELTCDASWITFSPSAGARKGVVTVSASSNSAMENLSATITITGTGIPTPLTISVTQSGIAPSINIEMVEVLGGQFIMGCTSDQGNDCYDDEKPLHNVTLSTFYIGKFEVTQGEWKAVMGANPSYFPKGDNYPVEWVSWNDIVGTNGASMEINGITYYANGFIYKLNQMTSMQYRLPTEAEWEYAARGGQSSGWYRYSGSYTVENVAWYYNNSGNSTHPVGTKEANELGIYDMSGNVWEWCSDWYSSTYYNSSPPNNPIGPSTGSYRVVRGDCWNFFVEYARVSFRYFSWPDFSYGNFGFRLARSSN